MAVISPLLGLGMATTSAVAGYTAGQAEVAQSKKDDQVFSEQRAAAKQRKEQGDLQLAQMRRDDSLAQQAFPTREAQLQAELEAQRLQTAKISNTLVKNETLGAFDDYFESGDPKSWNYLLKQNKDNPKVKSMFGDTVHLATLDPVGDRKLLQSMGLPDNEFPVQVGDKMETVNLDKADGKADGKIDWEKLKRRFVKAIDSNGEVKIVDTIAAAAAMGYDSYASEKKLARMSKLADIRKKQQKNGSQKPSSFAEKRAAEADYQRTVARGDTPTALQTAGHKLVLSETGGDKEVRREGSEQALVEFERQFSTTSIEELRGSPKARKLVRAIETEYGMSKADEARVSSLAKVTTLSNSAALLSTAETGVMDKALSSLGGYFSDDTKTKTNKMAYGAMLNSVRHSLFGSAQTAGELKLFREAYGGLGQQTGPVLAGLSQAMQQIAAELGSVADRYPEPVVRMRFGKSREDIRSAVAMLNKRVDFYNRVSEGMTDEDITALAKDVFGSGGPQAIATGQGPAPTMSAADIATELGL